METTIWDPDLIATCVTVVVLALLVYADQIRDFVSRIVHKK